jgi:hypothetical protein
MNNLGKQTGSGVRGVAIIKECPPQSGHEQSDIGALFFVWRTTIAVGDMNRDCTVLGGKCHGRIAICIRVIWRDEKRDPVEYLDQLIVTSMIRGISR